jgi:hypothetical protein
VNDNTRDFNDKDIENCYVITHLNINKNQIDDKGISSFAHIIRDHSYLFKLSSLSLSRCSLTSKGINNLFSTTAAIHHQLSNLTSLDLSFNNLKEEPIHFFNYLISNNNLNEINLSSTDIDIEKLFSTLGRSDCCKKYLNKLILTGNTFNHVKKSMIDSISKYFSQTSCLSHLDLSNCKLNGTVLQLILSSMRTNVFLYQREPNFFLNLASNNDIGSATCLKLFLNDLSLLKCLTSLDMTDTNLDADSDTLINALIQNNSIESLCLSKNFINTKTKHVKRLIQSLVTLITNHESKLKSLWIADCKLRSNINELINNLDSCTTLKHLDISGNEIGDFGINLLSKSLQMNRSIETISIDKSNANLAHFSKLIDALKRLIIIFIYKKKGEDKD